MCGIAGIIGNNGPLSEGLLKTMADTLVHRGPDDAGTYLDESAGVGFAQRRLSFLDISPAGRQPMLTPDGQLVVVFNGEIYNYRELREELEALGHVFHTRTDTEVLLYGYLAWGKALPGRLMGMFAFALFDRVNQKMLLIRDHFGIKPLFYAAFGNRLVFGSEIKAIFAVPDVPKRIRRQSVAEFLANRYVPAPHTMWRDIYKLPPAHGLEIDTETGHFERFRYWNLQVGETPYNGDIDAAIREKLDRSVSFHQRSDVPVGSFLSGGMDSTTLLYFMRKHEPQVQAFAIGFPGWEKSEHRYAEMASAALGAELHTGWMEGMGTGDLDKLMYHYDDPVADISILPTYRVSALAAGHVKAVCSGEGADEMFGGYWWQQPSRFYWPGNWARRKARIIGKSFADIKRHYIEAMSMGLFDAPELNRAFTDEWRDAVPADPFAHFDRFRLKGVHPLKQIQYLDIHTFMPELVLAKVDRASMAHSLEVRVPFLDHRFVSWMFGLPVSAYFDPGVQKFRLRKLLEGIVPPEIYARSKQGFVGPDEYYMDFSAYGNSLLTGRLVREEIIRETYVASLIAEKEHWKLWKLYVLEAWWKRWVTEENV